MINDSDLLIIIGLALQTAQKHPQFEELQDFMTQWQDALRCYGPGCIDLKLERLDEASEKLERLRELLTMVMNRISQFNETIPAQVLNEQISVRGVEFYDYRIHLVEDALEKIHILIGSKKG